MKKQKNLGCWEHVIGNIYESAVNESHDEKPGALDIPAKAYTNSSDFIGLVQIPEGVKNIGDYAFMGCNNMNEIIFPSTLVTIHTGAFMECKNLEKLDFSKCKNLKLIDRQAFQNCESIEKINLPDSLETIGTAAFARSGLSGDLKIPNGVRKLGDSAFANCRDLDGNLQLSWRLKSIGYKCFSRCYFDGVLRIPEEVEEIGEKAFEGNQFKVIRVTNDVFERIPRGWREGLNAKLERY